MNKDADVGGGETIDGLAIAGQTSGKRAAVVARLVEPDNRHLEDLEIGLVPYLLGHFLADGGEDGQLDDVEDEGSNRKDEVN